MKKALIIHPDELNTKWVDRMVSLGVSTLALHPTGGVDAHMSLDMMLRLLEQPEYRARIDYAVSRGLSIEYEMHAASFLVPRELFEKRPDWFRMEEDGTRTPKYNFCASHPAAVAFAAKRAVELVSKLYRSEHRYYIWLDDLKDVQCHCPACQKLSPSDQQLTVMNAFIKELRRVQPDATLAYLAYENFLPCPEQVQPEEGIFLEYADIVRVRNIHIREATALHENIEKSLALFGKKNSRVLEYWYDNSFFSKWKKPPVQFIPDNPAIRDDIRWYINTGFENIASFACFLGEDYEALYGEPDISAFAEN